MGIKSVLQRHPVWSYFVLAYLIAWGGSFAVAGPKFLRGETLLLADALLMFFPMLIGPSLAGLIMTAVVDGKQGLHDLLARMRRWRVGPRWGLALFIFPVLIVAVQLGLAAVASPDYAPYLFPMGILIGLLAGYFEEIGWTGFALPKMMAHQNALVVGVVLGVIHSLWHVLADYVGASGTRGDYWLLHFAMFLVSMTAVRVLIVWVYANTHSVLLAQLMHASSTGFLSVLVPLSLSPRQDTIFYAVYAVVLWVVVMVVVAWYGKHLVATNPGVLAA